MNKKCTSFKPAHYLCVNKNCLDHNPFMCADPEDVCKVDHQSCSMVSWLFLEKKVMDGVSPEIEIFRAETIKPFYEILKKVTKAMENILHEDRSNSQMKEILKGHLGPTEKGRINEFIGESNAKTLLDSQQLHDEVEDLKYYIDKFEAKTKGSKIKKQGNSEKMQRASEISKNQ